jgi:formiminoglutamase
MPTQVIPTSPHLFFSKNDSEDVRLGELFKPCTLDLEHLQTDDYVILGYPDDEGIKLNGGRPGASEAPKFIRQFLYKMSLPFRQIPMQKYLDLGDLEIKDELPSRHQFAQQIMNELHQKKAKTLTFGGGHDYGYSDTSAFVKNFLSTDEKPLVINFDAHLDVRPTNLGFNSGTPFYRLLNEFGTQFDFVEVGLQPQCNSVYHRDWALSKGAHLFDLRDLPANSLQSLFENPVLKKIKKSTPVFVSFDIDCLTSSEAGGCSQSWVTGLKMQPCLDFLNHLYKISDCRGLGIYEVSPALDQDFRTSKTAALLAYHFIFQNLL